MSSSERRFDREDFLRYAGLGPAPLLITRVNGEQYP
jgi:hypothetical protein